MQNLKDGGKTYERYFYKLVALLEGLTKVRIPGEATQVLRLIERKTFGWRKDKDRIALEQFVNGTGLKKPNVVRARNLLESMNIIVIEKDNEGNLIYSINVDLASWKPLSKKITLSKKIMSVIEKDNKSLSKKIPTIKNYNKELNNKEKESAPSAEEGILVETIDEELTELLLSQILKNHPTWKLSKPNDQKKARKEWPGIIARMRQIDFRKPEEIREMILWGTEHDFWTGNLRSAESLRRNWDGMQAQKDRDAEKIESLSDDQVAQKVFEKLKKRKGKE